MYGKMIKLPKYYIAAPVKYANFSKKCWMCLISSEIKNRLALVFNKSLRSGIVPEDWRVANVEINVVIIDQSV